MSPTTLSLRLTERIALARARHRLARDFRRLIATGDPLPHRDEIEGPQIGIATFGSGIWHLVIECLLAHALRQRGARPELLVCDLPSLPVCDERTSLSKHLDTCSGCFDDKAEFLSEANIPWRRLTSFLRPGALERAGATVAAI